MEEQFIRTDLALEERERFVNKQVEISGVEIEEVYKKESDITITTVRIRTEKAANIMGKSKGNYITIEAPDMSASDEVYHKEVAKELSEQMKKIMPERNKKTSILVVGLGNRNITPDALGPKVIEQLIVSRHLIKAYGYDAFETEKIGIVSALVPGVMAQTGMETLEIIQGVVSVTKPDQMIIIDALAARSTKRLNRTIQISDAGIHPGSGVGNHREALTKETLGIPVIAVGVPTVVDAATIVRDNIQTILDQMESQKDTNCFLEQLLSPQLNGMFVTPKDIDENIERISCTISEGLNQAFTF